MLSEGAKYVHELTIQCKDVNERLSCTTCGSAIQTAELSLDGEQLHLLFKCPKCGFSYRKAITLGKTEVVTTEKPAEGPIYTKVSGVTYENPDGTKRQDILAHVQPGDELTLEEQRAKGGTVYKVFRHKLGVIGSLRPETMSVFEKAYPGATPKAVVVRITGGTDGKETRGCNIELMPDNTLKQGSAPARGKHNIVYTTENSRIFHTDPRCYGLRNATAVDLSKNPSAINGLHACKRCAEALFPNIT